jgi:Cys-tRNA(Pro) deacylase
MASPDTPATSAIRFLRDRHIPFTPYFYRYEEHGGTSVASTALGVNEHAVIKTLVLQTDTRTPLIVLMHGDREVSTRQLARTIGVKRVEPCDAAAVVRLTGYVVGGVSPFGTRTRLPVYVERTILGLTSVLINGGKRGFLVGLVPEDIVTALEPTPVDVAVMPA